LRGAGLLAAGVGLGYLAFWLIRWVERNFAGAADRKQQKGASPE